MSFRENGIRTSEKYLPLKKIKRRWVCACVCVNVHVCGGVHMDVYVYRSDIKGRNKDSNNSSLVGKMLI